MIKEEYSARLGITEEFRVGDIAGADRRIEMLQELGIRHARLVIMHEEYHTSTNAVWYDWLLSRLSKSVELLVCLSGFTSREAGAREGGACVADVIDRHGRCFTAVELPVPAAGPGFAANQDFAVAASEVRGHGKRVVLGGVRADVDCSELFDLVDVIGFDVGSHPVPNSADCAQVVVAARHAHRGIGEFWITQAGYSTWRHDEATQARCFTNTLQAPVSRVYWSSLQDRDPLDELEADPQRRSFGMYDLHGIPKLLARLLESGVGEVAQAVADAELAAPNVVATRPLLVTGGAGFIGANLADRLAADGEHVRIYDSLARPGVEHNLRWLVARHPGRVSVTIADLRDDAALADAARDASGVFHLASQVAVTSSLLRPVHDFDINVRGTVTLLDILRRRNPDAPLLFASTNKVYGDLADIELVCQRDRWVPRDEILRARGVDESRALSFHTPYGCSKGAADQYVLDYARSYGLRTAVLRMSCVYGERQLGTEDQGWLAHFILQALAGKPLSIYGDGCQVRDVLHVGDAVGAYCAAWRNIGRVAGSAFNLGGGPANAISLRQLIGHLEMLLDCRIELDFSDWRAGDQRYFVADARAICDTLELPEPLGWREGVARLAAHFANRSSTDAPLTARETEAAL